LTQTVVQVQVLPPAWFLVEHAKISTMSSRRSFDAFEWGCQHFGLDPATAKKVLESAPPDTWGLAFGGDIKGGRAAHCLGHALGRKCCAEGNHKEEARLGLSLVKEVATDELPAYRDAWVVALGGVLHQLDEEVVSNCEELERQLHVLAKQAIADLDRRFSVPGKEPPSTCGDLDSVAVFLFEAERRLGLPLSPVSADYDRRKRNRDIRARAGRRRRVGAIRYEDLAPFMDERQVEWFRARFEEKLGRSAPSDLFIKSSSARSGVQVNPEFYDSFDPADYRAFDEDMRAKYRAANGLPAKGEGWLSQTQLAKCVAEVLSGVEVLREARPSWLGSQRLDIYVPSLGFAIEYQGEQHYYPLEHWGGEQGLKDRKEMDARKKKACKKAGVRLLEWKYHKPITADAVAVLLKRKGVKSRKR